MMSRYAISSLDLLRLGNWTRTNAWAKSLALIACGPKGRRIRSGPQTKAAQPKIKRGTRGHQPQSDTATADRRDQILRCPDHAAVVAAVLRVGPGLAPPASLVAPPRPGRRRRGHLLRRAPRGRAAAHALLLRLRAPRVGRRLRRHRTQPRPRRAHACPPSSGEGRA